jgi:cyclic pyranopterin phosphate synthase
MKDKLTHFNPEGRARMVDVSEKAATARQATAKAAVRVNGETYERIVSGGMKKGDVLAVAQVAGIMGAKRTPDIIPMCHPIALTGVDIRFELEPETTTIHIYATARCTGQTGVEMEAMTAASVAALTIYDMCKAVQRDIVLESVYLLEKSGGKSGLYRWEEEHG